MIVVAKMEYENTKTLSQIACHAPKLVFNVQYLGEDSRAALNRGLYQTMETLETEEECWCVNKVGYNRRILCVELLILCFRGNFSSNLGINFKHFAICIERGR